MKEREVLTVIGCVQYHSGPIISRGNMSVAGVLDDEVNAPLIQTAPVRRLVFVRVTTRIVMFRAKDNPLSHRNKHEPKNFRPERGLTYQSKRYHMVKCKHYLEVVVYDLIELHFARPVYDSLTNTGVIRKVVSGL